MAISCRSTSKSKMPRARKANSTMKNFAVDQFIVVCAARIRQGLDIGAAAGALVMCRVAVGINFRLGPFRDYVPASHFAERLPVKVFCLHDDQAVGFAENNFFCRQRGAGTGQGVAGTKREKDGRYQ